MGSLTVATHSFLANGGQVGALMRTHDWSQSALGVLDSWPESLRAITGMMLNSKFAMFAAWGPELSLLYNDDYAEILGTKHPDALGRPLGEVWPEVWSEISPSIERALQGHAVYHQNLPLAINRNGRIEDAWFTFSYSPVRGADGQVAGMFCTATETTEQVLAERHRAQELSRLQQLFQQAPGIIAVLQGQTHIFDIANDAYRSLVGHRDILGKPIRAALPELDGQGFFDLLDQVYSSGKPYFGNEVPVMLQREIGGELEERYVNFIYQPTFDHRGNITGIFVEGSDVTESVRVHRALQESELELRAASRRKDEFLAMLAHELRNPLAPIATAATLLKVSSFDEVRVRKSSEVITRQVRHMTKLIDDLLDVSRVTRGLVTLQRETLNVDSLLRDAVEQVRPLMEKKRQHFTVQTSSPHLFVQGDPTRLIQVFSNILNNAAKYTPEHGHITVSVVANDSQVQVTVEDDGVGISPSLLPHIFKLFTQAERSPDRAQGGLGLGLALVKSLLERQGGLVVAHSDGPGAGSRFTVSLPQVELTKIPPELCSQEDQIQYGVARKVLIVDDDKEAAATFQVLLEAAGQEVFIAHNAPDALSATRNISPVCLFLDIGLSEIDGYELARLLRSLPEMEGCSLVALTGYDSPEDRKRASEAAFDHFLVKPVKPSDLSDLLAQLEH